MNVTQAIVNITAATGSTFAQEIQVFRTEIRTAKDQPRKKLCPGHLGSMSPGDTHNRPGAQIAYRVRLGRLAETGRRVSLDPLGRFEVCGVEARTITHFHARTPQILTAKVCGSILHQDVFGSRRRWEDACAGPLRAADTKLLVLRTNKPLCHWFQDPE